MTSRLRLDARALGAIVAGCGARSRLRRALRNPRYTFLSWPTSVKRLSSLRKAISHWILQSNARDKNRLELLKGGFLFFPAQSELLSNFGRDRVGTQYSMTSTNSCAFTPVAAMWSHDLTPHPSAARGGGARNG